METIIKVNTKREDYDIRDSAECSLTVQDVIDILEFLPKDAKIVMSNNNGSTFAPFRENTFEEIEVETREEEEERLRKEKEEEDKSALVCPKCLSENICHTRGMWQCLDCGKYFKAAKLIQISQN